MRCGSRLCCRSGWSRTPSEPSSRRRESSCSHRDDGAQPRTRCRGFDTTNGGLGRTEGQDLQRGSVHKWRVPAEVPTVRNGGCGPRCLRSVTLCCDRRPVHVRWANPRLWRASAQGQPCAQGSSSVESNDPTTRGVELQHRGGETRSGEGLDAGCGVGVGQHQHRGAGAADDCGDARVAELGDEI